MIGKSVAWFFKTSRDLIAQRLVKWHVTPNMLTVAGGVCTALTGVTLAAGIATGQKFFYPLGVVLLYWCAACDMLDGAVARIGNKGSEFGGFLDSTVDRVSDFLLWGGVCMGFLLQEQPNITFAVLSIIAMFNGVMISYTKARAEDFIDSCKVGFWQRGERFAAILFATLAANPGSLVVQQSISPAFTTWRRIKFTYDTMKGKNPVADPRVNGKWYHKIQPWMYPQMSWPYDLIVLANIAWLLFAPVNPAKWDVIGEWINPSYPVLTQEIPQPVISRKVIKVSSARELLEKIESNSIIELAPGKYDLTGIYSGKEKYTRHVAITSAENPGDELTLQDLHNVKIRGLGKKPVSITTAFAGVNVLIFSHCSGIELSNLSVGHDSPRGFCAGGVIVLKNCDNVLIGDCDLFGCGVEGLTAINSSKITLCDSIIRECSDSIMSLQNCQIVNFINFEFINNICGNSFIGISGCEDVFFAGCRINNNKNIRHDLGYIFEIYNSKKIKFKSGSIEKNKANNLTNNTQVIEFSGTYINYNEFIIPKIRKPKKTDNNTVKLSFPTPKSAES